MNHQVSSQNTLKYFLSFKSVFPPVFLHRKCYGLQMLWLFFNSHKTRWSKKSKSLIKLYDFLMTAWKSLFNKIFLQKVFFQAGLRQSYSSIRGLDFLATTRHITDKEKKPPKELSLCHKFNASNPYIFVTWLCKLLIFQT